MLVSVIIPTKNEEKNIKNCLDSIRHQSFPAGEIEVIIADDGSTDKTKEIARNYTDNVFDKDPGRSERSAQRNFGAQKALGKYIFYLDADMTLSPDVISECVSTLEKNNEIVALYVPEIIRGDNFWNKVRRFERSFYDGTVIDAARFMRRDIFMKIGGFDETLTGPEDWDLDKKIRKIEKINLIKNPLYHQESQFSVKNYLKKKAYYSQDFAIYSKKWGKKDSDIQKQLGFYYRFWGVFTENGKWKKLLSHPILTTEMYFLRFLVGVNYITRKK